MKQAKPQRKIKEGDLTPEELLAIKNLETNDGWLALQKVLRKNINWLKNQIINDDDLSTDVRMTQRDLARQWLKYQQRILHLPEKLTQAAEDDSETNPIRLDPYPETIEEIREIK